MNNQEEMNAAKADLEAAQAKLAAAQKRLEEMSKPKKWHPKGGDYYVSSRGQVDGYLCPHPSVRLTGSLYPTYEAAKSAAPYITSYKRLCCLAQELNPSGLVGGDYGVYLAPYNGEGWVSSRWWTNDNLGLFETAAAAEDACRIMNRDGWKLHQ